MILTVKQSPLPGLVIERLTTNDGALIRQTTLPDYLCPPVGTVIKITDGSPALEALAAKKIKADCSVLTEGLQVPSETIFIQSYGRGLRPKPRPWWQRLWAALRGRKSA